VKILTAMVIVMAAVCVCGEAAGAAKDAVKVLPPKEAKPKQPNPLDLVADEMLGAQVQLKQGLTNEGTQIRQAKAIELLDRLIDIAQKQQQQQQEQDQQQKQQQEKEQQTEQAKPENSAANQQEESTTPARGSQESGASAKPAVTGNAPPGQKGIEWGNLPPKAREEFNQIMKEDFPEIYKNLLELYFKNLSDR